MAPPPKKNMKKINNAPVHPYQDDNLDDDEGVNPFQPVAPSPIKLPPVNKLGGLGKPVNYDFSNAFNGPPGSLPPIGRTPQALPPIGGGLPPINRGAVPRPPPQQAPETNFNV